MEKAIPKVIWLLWAQGWDNTPPLIEKCKSTWIEHNPGWTIKYLTSENLSDYIDMDTILPDYKQKNIPTVSLSNVIRLALLKKYGGVWADATVYCNKPLDEWLPEYTAGNGFFAFANPGPDRMLSTWFLAAPAQHTIVEKWLQGCIDYWKDRNERHTYHWCHYTFGDLYHSDKILKELWDQTVKISADGPHYFLPYEKTLFKKLNKKVKDVIDHPSAAVFKLTFKYDERRLTKKTTLYYLLSDQKESFKEENWLQKLLPW